MNPTTLLTIFAALVLTGITLIGTTSEDLGFRDRSQQFLPEPVPLILPESAGLPPSRDFTRSDQSHDLPPGLVSLPPWK